MMSHLKKKYLFITTIYIIMFLVAISDNLRGPFSQYIKQDFNVGDNNIGIMFLICSFSYMIFTLIGGKLLSKIGHKHLIALGLLISIFSIFKIYMSITFLDLLMGLFFLNAGEGFLLVSFNTYIPTISSKYKGTIMNLLHIFYGIGAFATQISIPLLFKHNITWRILHLIISMCLLICLLSILSIPLSKSSKFNVQYCKPIVKQKPANKYILLLYIIALGSYISAESCTGNWLPTYLYDGLGISKGSSAIYLSLFYIFITIGRLFGGYLADLFGHLKLSFISILGGFFCYMLGYIFFKKTIILICVSGTFLSIYFPTMLLTLSKSFKNTSSQTISFIMSSSSLFCMLLNYLIGKTSSFANIYTAFLFIPLSLGVSAICTTLICYEIFKLQNRALTSVKNIA